jgi:WD40 repeat protein
MLQQYAWALMLALMSVSTLAAQSNAKPRLDAYGDPLPDRAIARLGTLRWKHECDVNSVLYSPDGKKILTATYEPHLWDASTGKKLPPLANQEKYYFYHGAFSPDGKLSLGELPCLTHLKNSSRCGTLSAAESWPPSARIFPTQRPRVSLKTASCF